MNERENHKKAFEFYYGMGEGRNYRKVAEEFGVSIGAVKLWGRSFGWKRRVADRDAEVARSLAGQSLSDGVERATRDRKIIEMALVRVAQAIAEGKVKPTIADLDRLIRLEELLRKEGEEKRPMFVYVWSDPKSKHKKDKTGNEDNAGTIPAEEED